MTNFDKEFPATSSFTYLNTPGIGLLSKQVYDYRNHQNAELFQKGSRFRDEIPELMAETREKIALFFNTEAGNTALMPAFSFGFNTLLEGVKPQTKILLLENDYPSINLAVEARDFKISYTEINADLEENIYQAFKQNQPEVFIFSIVQYLNGMKIDLDFLKTLKNDFPETLIVADGTQYLGTEHFDFKNSGIDVLGASAYKWLNAGLGNAFFTFKPNLEKKINPKHLGFASDIGKYKEAGDTLIGKFEGSHLDTSNIGSIKIALELQKKIGTSNIEKKVKELSEAAKSAFQDLNLLEKDVADRENHSNIFNLKGDDELLHKLNDNNILCSQRGKGIRVGFHYYNTMDDLEKLLHHLKN